MNDDLGVAELPFVLVGDGQVELFRTREALEASVESCDVSLYKIYDSKGRQFHLTDQPAKTRILSLTWETRSVKLHEVPGDPTGSEELRSTLVDWWRRSSRAAHASVEAAECTLEALVQALLARDGAR